MPDRTQTLLVERHRHIPDLHDEPHAKLVPDPDGPWVRYSDVAALLQPEHQGDEAPEPDVDLDPMQGMGAYEAWKDGWVKGRAAQPPAPVLDEKRERLREIADAMKGENPTFWHGDAAFLRNLASQEHRRRWHPDTYEDRIERLRERFISKLGDPNRGLTEEAVDDAISAFDDAFPAPSEGETATPSQVDAPSVPDQFEEADEYASHPRCREGKCELGENHSPSCPLALLGALAEEFERQAAQAKKEALPNPAEQELENHDFYIVANAREQAASLVREKAAKLKEGE